MRYENKTKRAPVVAVTMPSGRKVRITLPIGEFELPNAHRIALEATPVGAALLKKFKVKPKQKKKDGPKIEADSKQADEESS